MIKRDWNLITKLPEKHGIYFLFNSNKELIYIGKAKNMKTRMLQHYHNYKNYCRHQELLLQGIKPSHIKSGIEYARPFEYFRYSIINDLKLVHHKELELIHSIKPFMNRTLSINLECLYN